MNLTRNERRNGSSAVFAIMLAIGCLAGCGGNDPSAQPDSEPFFDHEELPLVRLAGSTLTDAPAIGQPSLLQINNEILWISDMASDPGLHAVDANSGSLLISVGTRGEGPGEFSTSPFGLDAVPGDSGIWTFDLRLQRISRFEPRPPTDYGIRTINLQGTPRILRVAWLSPDLIVGQSNSASERFSLFSRDGVRLSVVPGPILGPESAPLAERLKASNAAVQICPWPGRGFAVVNFKVSRIEMFDQGARFVKTAQVPFDDEARFTAGSDGRVKFESVREWYMDCAVSNDRLFALFSGRRGDAYTGVEKFASEFIHVFNWAGTLTGVYALGKPVTSITVEETGKVIFASSLLDATVYRFSIQ